MNKMSRSTAPPANMYPIERLKARPGNAAAVAKPKSTMPKSTIGGNGKRMTPGEREIESF